MSVLKVCTCVRADYQVEARFFRYWNPGHLRFGQPVSGDGCCDIPRAEPQCPSPESWCDNSFIICLHKHIQEPGASCSDISTGDALRLESVTVIKDDNLMFEEGPDTLQGLPIPVVFSVTGPWPVSGFVW